MPYKTRSLDKRSDIHTIDMAPNPSAPPAQSQQDTAKHYQGFQTCKKYF